MDSQLQHITEKARAARIGGFCRLSTGEKLAAALVLNRPDWLDSMGYTIAEAIDRLDHGWVERLMQAERILNDE
ncbi:MAG: hypothetical protein QM625_09220 [Ralstonia sp.]|jgi:hypothetical protein|uniref:Uncharacterized protein n=2 Tax=Ralstonia TaxID=48736 RepID=A0ABN9IV87_9RALS|nr:MULTISPECIES: hypothetical protein [Ralstonia]MBA9845246.1 hypothetical protein [Ralstonia pickettii]MBA9852362.1 hypothetical protein [Ralstonia pickettii]MBA9878666.1 hypothetical protein [Ralstonia pickettii]MBA9881899.1 hypothetical protein [Ralstonia pickettii]MBA9888742.1 hypothetical protein [Ralstonia pickettii]